MFSHEIQSTVEDIIGSPRRSSDGRGDLPLPVNAAESVISLVQHEHRVVIVFVARSVGSDAQVYERVVSLESSFAERSLCMIARRETFTDGLARFLPTQLQAASAHSWAFI